MSAHLIGRRIAILADDGVDTDELDRLSRSLTAAAAEVELLSIPTTPLLTLDTRGGVDHVVADAPINEMRVDDYAALVVPSGRGPHAQLRYHRAVTRLLRTAVQRGSVVATGRSAAGLLVEAGLVRGRRVTSSPRLRHELRSAGARWMDLAVARDSGVLTTQRPDATLLAHAIVDEVAALSALSPPPPPRRPAVAGGGAG